LIKIITLIPPALKPTESEREMEKKVGKRRKNPYLLGIKRNCRDISDLVYTLCRDPQINTPLERWDGLENRPW